MRRSAGACHWRGRVSWKSAATRRGEVVAEFGYGGKLLPTFPAWMIEPTRPSRLAWFLKERLLPPIYWHFMLNGREWFCAPQRIERAKA